MLFIIILGLVVFLIHKSLHIGNSLLINIIYTTVVAIFCFSGFFFINNTFELLLIKNNSKEAIYKIVEYKNFDEIVINYQDESSYIFDLGNSIIVSENVFFIIDKKETIIYKVKQWDSKLLYPFPISKTYVKFREEDYSRYKYLIPESKIINELPFNENIPKIISGKGDLKDVRDRVFKTD